MIRVAHLCNCSGIGGTEQMVLQYCKYRDRQRFEYLVATPEGGAILPEIEATGVPVWSGPGAIQRAIAAADVVNLHVFHPEPELLAMIRAAGKPFVHTIHNHFTLPGQPSIAICTSRNAYEIQEDPSRCVLIPNGVDLERFTVPRKPRTSEVILTRVCRPPKCAPYFWDAMNQVLKRYPQARLWIVGNPRPCESRSEQVRFLGLRRDIPEILAQSDLFVYTPYPGLGSMDLVTMEASAAGIPCVVSDVDCVRERVLQGENGFLTPFADVRAFVQQVGRLIEDAELRERLGRNAAQMAREQFSMVEVNRRYEAVYRSVLEFPARSPRSALPALPREAPRLPDKRWENYRGDWDTPAVSPPPAFSVVMPCHNMAHRGLDRAIESVQEQTLTDWELLVVDDGSTDGSDRVVEHYAARDPRIRLRRQANTQICGARNAGYWLARGEFIAHLDGDDEYLPHKLERQLEAFIRNPWAGVAFGQALDRGKPIFNYGFTGRFENSWEAVREFCYTPCQSVVLRRSLLHAVGGNDHYSAPLRRKAQDWDQWARAFSVSEAEVLYEPIYLLHRHPDSLTALAGSTPAGMESDAMVRERIARLDIARRALHSRPTRIFMTGMDAYSRGAQVQLLSLVRHLPREEFEITVGLARPEGELLELLLERCRVVPLAPGVEREVEAADLVHHHYYGWNPNPNVPQLVDPSRLIVTEHSGACRWDGPGRVVRVWSGRRPEPNAPLAPEFNPAWLEIQNPIDLPTPAAGASDPLGLAEGPLVLGLLPAQHYKGIDLWLDAAEGAWRKRPDLVFALVGFRAEHDEQYGAAVERIERLQGEGMRISYHPPQSREVVADLCSRAAVLLHLPRAEALGLALLEAQAHGTPVVAAAVGGTRQAVYHGRVVAPESTSGAANALLDVVGKRVPEAGRHSIRWRHDPRRVAASYAELYRWQRLLSLLRPE